MTNHHHRLYSAFSLLELSIVLVIIGLLTGGVLAGKSLIRGAELQEVTTELQKYTTAVNSFKDKYQAIPGDFNNATKFWGFAGTAAAPGCTSTSGITTVTTGGTCDGNGDGFMQLATASGNTAELFQFWKQLSLAKLVEGSYTGLDDGTAANGTGSTPGLNVPKSKVSNAGWSIYNWGTFAGNNNLYPGTYNNVFIFGALDSGSLTTGPALKPEEAWNIDNKLDDGLPGSGSVVIFNTTGTWWSGSGANTNCTNSTAAIDTTKDYNKANSSVLCSLIFTNAF